VYGAAYLALDAADLALDVPDKGLDGAHEVSKLQCRVKAGEIRDCQARPLGRPRRLTDDRRLYTIAYDVHIEATADQKNHLRGFSAPRPDLDAPLLRQVRPQGPRRPARAAGRLSPAAQRSRLRRGG
jgi:hypothetical protein